MKNKVLLFALILLGFQCTFKFNVYEDLRKKDEPKEGVNQLTEINPNLRAPQANIRPDQQTSKTADSLDAIYTQETGVLQKVTFYNAKKYFTPDIEQDWKTYTPDTSGNTLDLMDVVKDSLGGIWYIDSDGDAVKLYDQNQSQTISLDGNNLTLSNSGGTVDLSTAGVTSAQLGDTATALRNEYSILDDFDSDRSILRTPTAGVNIGGSTVADFLNYFYFVAPSITLTLSPTANPVEVGTSTQIILTGATSNAGGATLSNGSLDETSPGSATLKTFTSSTSVVDTITFTPQQGGSGTYNELAYTFTVSQDWAGSGESGSISNAKSIQAIYPILYGVSATDFTSTGDPYTTITKLVQAEGNKTLTLDGTGFAYYLIPTTWTDTALSQIRDQNDFDVTASFTVSDINISSTGLTNDYSTVAYKMYKANVSATYSSAAYDFVR